MIVTPGGLYPVTKLGLSHSCSSGREGKTILLISRLLKCMQCQCKEVRTHRDVVSPENYE